MISMLTKEILCMQNKQTLARWKQCNNIVFIFSSTSFFLFSVLPYRPLQLSLTSAFWSSFLHVECSFSFFIGQIYLRCSHSSWASARHPCNLWELASWIWRCADTSLSEISIALLHSTCSNRRRHGPLSSFFSALFADLPWYGYYFVWSSLS